MGLHRRERLKLMKSEVGLMSEGGEATSDVFRLVLQRMLTAGFAHLSDLTPSARIGASYTQSTKVGALRLDGKLSDLMTLYPLSRDDYVIVLRASTAPLSKKLPVTFSLDEAVLDDYEEALRHEDESRREERTRLETAVASYSIRYDKALAEYNDKVAWWQKAREPDGPPEKATFEAFVFAAQDAQAALERSGKSTTRDQLQRDTAERREVRSVELIGASAEVIVYEVNTGTIATVITLREEGQDTDEALSRLADAITTTLGRL